VNLHPDSRVVNEARSGRSRERGQEHEAKAKAEANSHEAEAEAKIALIISQILHFDPFFSRKNRNFLSISTRLKKFRLKTGFNMGFLK